jgi:CrcB protein
MKVILIFLGGGIGSSIRYFIGMGFLKLFDEKNFPWGTLLANIISCLLLAIFVLATKGNNNELLRLFFVVGLCGGLSTFSTFGWETVQLIQQGKSLMAIANVLLSLTLCLPLLFWVAQKTMNK